MSAAARSTHDSWWRSAPVLVIAVLALIVSTAGGAYAVGKNSIGTKQLKNNAVTSSKIKSSTIASSDVKNNTIASPDIKDGSLTSGDFAPGQLAPMPAGSSRIYFAKVAPDGTMLGRSAAVASARRVSEGSYEVSVGLDATLCALTATTSDGFRTAHATLDGSTTIDVVVQSLGGTPMYPTAAYPYANSGFSLTITC